MPKIFLSPSTQEFNPYIDGGNEEYYMNLIADDMEPYLTASGIEFDRNDPAGTVNNSVAQSNSGNYDLHLAIHSNASPASSAGKNRGTQVYYFPGSVSSTRAAEIFADNFRKIYPDPELVRTVPTASLAEIARTKAPAILIEVAYHDNRDDAKWIRENIDRIAVNLTMSTAEFLGVRFRTPEQAEKGIVSTADSPLNLRKGPFLSSEIISRIPRGTRLVIGSRSGDWYLTMYNGLQGFVNKNYVKIL